MSACVKEMDAAWVVLILFLSGATDHLSQADEAVRKEEENTEWKKKVKKASVNQDCY